MLFLLFLVLSFIGDGLDSLSVPRASSGFVSGRMRRKQNTIFHEAARDSVRARERVRHKNK